MSRTRLVGLTIAMLVITIGSMLGARHAHAGGGCTQPQSDAQGDTVDLKLFCMLPTVLRVDPGTTVTWRNADKAAHTVTGAAVRTAQPNAGSWGSFEELKPDESFTHTFDDAGVYPYYCMLHPGMIGAVVVGDGVASDPYPPGGPANTSGASGTTGRGSELQTSTQAQERIAAAPSSGIDGMFVAVLAAFAAAIGAGAMFTYQRLHTSRRRSVDAAR